MYDFRDSIALCLWPAFQAGTWATHVGRSSMLLVWTSINTTLGMYSHFPQGQMNSVHYYRHRSSGTYDTLAIQRVNSRLRDLYHLHALPTSLGENA